MGFPDEAPPGMYGLERTGQSERSVTGMPQHDGSAATTSRPPSCEVGLASMSSSGTGYVMPRGSNSGLVHRASVTEQPAPVVLSASRGGVFLPSVSGQFDPLARLVIEAPHADRLVDGLE